MEDERPNILFVGGSIRSSGRLDDTLIEIAQTSADTEETIARLEEISRRKLCNSEGLATIAMQQAHAQGANISFFSLRQLFSARRQVTDYVLDTSHFKQEGFKELIDGFETADGVVLASPVYFGDRSSLTDAFLKVVNRDGLLRDRGFGAISVGAKRNGGQETANVYALFDAINAGAFAHGNGLKTSQYGGTAMGGDRKTALRDEFGVETSAGVGRRASQVSRILRHGLSTTSPEPINIGVIVTADNDRKDVESAVQSLLSNISDPRANFNVVNLFDYDIESCIGCNACPNPALIEKGSPKGTDYACIILNDGVEAVREELKGADAFIVVGTNSEDPTMVNKYQAFTERTRFIRRGDFEWMNRPFTSLVVKDIFSATDRLIGLRAMTSYMRHNTIVSQPLRIYHDNGTVMLEPTSELGRFVDRSVQIRAGREMVGPVDVSYDPAGTGGYEIHTAKTAAKRI